MSEHDWPGGELGAALAKVEELQARNAHLIDECAELKRRIKSVIDEKNDAVRIAENLRQQRLDLEKEIERSHMELDQLEDDRHVQMARAELLRERMNPPSPVVGSELRAEQAGKEAYSGWRELPVATERLGEAKVEYFADGRIKWSSGQIPPDAKQARMHIQGTDDQVQQMQRRAWQPDQPLPDLPKKKPWWLVW